MLKLLVVDDEMVILQGILKILREGNTPFTHIESALDAFEALSVLSDFKPDVIITDITMPEMNGLAFISKVKEQKLCDRFIILTGYDQFTYAKQALRMQVIDYLLKPIDKLELLTLLKKVANEIMEELKHSDRREDEESPSGYCTHIEKILNHIHRNYQQDLSLERLSELTDLHPSYISSLFKNEVGLSFIQYLQEYRMDKAKELIANHQSMSIPIVANQVGYENPQHFMKVFKKVVGCTPGRFRDQSQPNEAKDERG
jgi:two-component system, response regulator YesN